jgi:hypothetical protein
MGRHHHITRALDVDRAWRHAEFERELIRARTGEGCTRAKAQRREDGAQAEAYRSPQARGDQAPRLW